MEIGKVPENVLKRSIIRQIKHRREEVIVFPGVGEDCCAAQIGPDEVMVFSTDPITGTANNIGTLAVHVTANDIASGGAELIGILLSIILPEGTEESELKKIVTEAEAACALLNADIMGGHTEISSAVVKPLITVTGIGKVKKNELVTTAGLLPGQKLVMTKWAGLEGTAILANDREKELLSRYGKSFLEGASEFMSHISVVQEARIAAEIGVSAMHDITEGGVFGALWEMGEASNVGIEVEMKKIPIRQETVEICEFFDINPYMLISSGCLLIGTNYGDEIVDALQRAGIEAAVIGKVTGGRDKVIINGEERRFLEPPKSDELYKALG